VVWMRAVSMAFATSCFWSLARVRPRLKGLVNFGQLIGIKLLAYKMNYCIIESVENPCPFSEGTSSNEVFVFLAVGDPLECRHQSPA
jgi:hypothetical protein